jgi:uncharacterized damage-inducible protein DinB
MALNPYAKYLADADPIPVLLTTASRLQTLTAPLSQEQIDAAPAPGKWSIREIVAHLADCELVFAFRLRQTLAEDHTTLQPFNQEIWADRYSAYNFADALAMFTTTRNWNIKLLTTVSEAEEQKPATHPERGTMTFQTLLETIAGHDINHLEQVQAQIERIAG